MPDSDSVTRNILKTSADVNPSGETVVSVTAYEFRGEERTDYVSKHGGDGRWHDAPVALDRIHPRAENFAVRGPRDARGEPREFKFIFL